MKLTIFGIRHHGCGSARSLRTALAELKPDVVLIEGAPEANEIIHLTANEEMQTPVAILIYAPDEPKKAVYYPFAEFSPEWQAMKFALKENVAVKFIDLPQTHQLADLAKEKSDENNENSDDSKQSEIRNPKSKIRKDPLQFAAEAAGFSDGELWWENLIETRRSDEDLFAAILELMTALRDEAEKDFAAAEEISENSAKQIDNFDNDDLRESFMRQEIRQAIKQNYQNIAVVCGAWHAPKLTENSLKEFAKSDVAALKNLPKIKLSATWIPYTYSRLSFASGYGAGISSPEFYHQIWNNPESIAVNWLARVANLLRQQDLDASSASVIEAVRLAESLAAMRELSAIGLNELFDAVRSVLCFGEDSQLALIREKLIVGERLGRVPAETPAVPLQRDLLKSQKRLRLAPEAMQKTLELDLRKPNDLERSQLLHRLNLLEINWGQIANASGKGTFKEAWRVRWSPELEISIIEANVWGNTIQTAATNKVCDIARKSDKLSELTALVGQTLLSDLPEAVEFLMNQVAAKSAISSDIPTMMDALSPLADVLRYGNVRKTDLSAVKQVIDGLIVRICVGLLNACASLDDDAATKMFERIIAVNNSIGLLQNSEYDENWRGVLKKLSDSETLHGLISGRATRLLFDSNEFSAIDVENRIALALSVSREPTAIAAWLEGFLRGSGLVLLHNSVLLKTLDDWVATLKDEIFAQILPLLRRTFSSFQKPERRKIGEQIKSKFSGDNDFAANRTQETDFDFERANKVLPLLAQLLGFDLQK